MTEVQERVSHPAKFNSAILTVLDEVLDNAVDGVDGWVVDPFAGIGGIHDLATVRCPTFGVELEPEWGEQMLERGPGWIGDFFEWEPDFKVSAVVTSCTYGNRMADHHVPAATDTSKRITYRHSLGRELTEGNSGGMQWGVEYRAFHIKAWIRVWELLAGGGVFILNVKDHVRDGRVIEVADWHRKRIIATGFELLDDIKVPVKGMGFGANGQTRVDHERVLVFNRPRVESHWNVEGKARREAKRDAGGTRHVV